MLVLEAKLSAKTEQYALIDEAIRTALFCRNKSVEYKQTGWNLSEDRKYLNLTDGFGIGRLKLVGSRDLNFYQIEQIKRVRLVRRADGYYERLWRVRPLPSRCKSIW